MTYEDGLRAGLAIARAEQAKWVKEAKDHAKNYWGGMNSDYAQSDLKRAKIASRIAVKIEDQIRALARKQQSDEPSQ